MFIITTAVQLVAERNSTLLRHDPGETMEHKLPTFAGRNAPLLIQVLALLGNRNSAARLRIVSRAVGNVSLEY